MTDHAAEHAPATSDVTGVVLAGGLSLRMRRDKAALTLDGQPLLRVVAERLGQVVRTVIVIGPERYRELVPDLSVVPDVRPGQGPLGGLQTALVATDTPHILAVACDMPWLNPDLLRSMIEQAKHEPRCDAVALRTPKGLEPLHTVYHRRILPLVSDRLEKQALGMRALLDDLQVCVVDTTHMQELDLRRRSLYNANTPDDWERVVQREAE